MLSRPRRRIRRVGSYSALLTMLVGWLFVFPVFDTGGSTSTIFGEVVFAGLLLASVSTAAGHPREMRFLAVVASVVIGASFLLHNEMVPGREGRVILEALRTVFLLLVMRAVLLHVFRSKVVSLDTILGAVCVYLMIAGVFAESYRILTLLDPNAIQYIDDGLGEALPSGYMRDRNVYFSIVTITTLGYGDVVPISSAARSLVQVEAVIGQLYVALALAWMVGMFMSEHRAAKLQDREGAVPTDSDPPPQ